MAGDYRAAAERYASNAIQKDHNCRNLVEPQSLEMENNYIEGETMASLKLATPVL